MIDSGMIDYALVVNGEDARRCRRPPSPGCSAETRPARDVIAEFATLTLGSGAAAMVLGPRRPAPRGAPRRRRRDPRRHRAPRAVRRRQRHDEHRPKGLLDAGLDLSADLWTDAAQEFGWARGWTATSCTRSPRCTPRDLRAPGHRPRPGTHAPSRPGQHRARLGAVHAGRGQPTSEAGDRVLLMGIGSGLNACVLEIVW